jgi:hypothetical protein
MRHTPNGQQLQSGWYWDTAIDESAARNEMGSGYNTLAATLLTDGEGGYNSSQSGPQKCWTDACYGGSYDPIALRWGECMPGYEGYMCASCAQTYYRLSNHCSTCPTYSKWAFIMAPICVFCLILAVLIAPISAKFVEVGVSCSVSRYIHPLDSSVRSIRWIYPFEESNLH